MPTIATQTSTSTPTSSPTQTTATIISMPMGPAVVKVAKNLGSAALSTPVSSFNFSNPIFDVQSKNIKFAYPLTPIGPTIESDYPLSPVRSYHDDTYYDTLDDDHDTKMKISKFFYEKMFNKWLLNDYKKLLHLFKVSGKSIKKVKSKKDFKKNKLSHSDKEKVIKFILNNVYDKYDLKRSIKKFSKKSRLRLVDLVDHKERVKVQIYRDLKQKIKEM